MIHLIMSRTGTQSTPISLEIGNDIYVYGEDLLFKKLESHINKDIKVSYIDEDSSNMYNLDDIDLSGEIPGIKLTKKEK